MALLGGAWTPNLLWYLGASSRRFGELRRDLPKISAKVLTARLRDLEAKGVVVRTVKPTSPPSVEYTLTDLGAELLPVIRAIVEVGAKLKERHPSAWHERRPKVEAETIRDPASKIAVFRREVSATTPPHDAPSPSPRLRPDPRPRPRARVR